MMTIIQRHYLKEFFKLFVIIALGLGLISSLIDLIDKIDDFMKYTPSLALLLFYAALNIPRFLVYLMPVSALISSLYVFGQAGKRKEIVAIKASGGGMKSLLTPFIYSGVFLCIAGFLTSEFIAPDFSKRAHHLSDMITKKETILTVKEGTAWLRAKEYIVKIDLYLPESRSIQGISIMKIQDDMLTERIEAASGVWQPVWGSRKTGQTEGAETSQNSRGAWYLRGVTAYDIKTGKVTHFREIQSGIIDSPDIIGKGMQKPEEMNVRELYAYTKRLKEAGIKNIKLVIDIHSRLSYPLINIIMLVVGISLSTRGEIKSGLVTTAIGIFISLLYWLGYTASLSLGYTGILPPIFAAWLVPVAFGGAAVYLFREIPE